MKSPDSRSVRSTPVLSVPVDQPRLFVLNPAGHNPMLLLTFTAGANRYAVDVAQSRRAHTQG